MTASPALAFAINCLLSSHSEVPVSTCVPLRPSSLLIQDIGGVVTGLRYLAGSDIAVHAFNPRVLLARRLETEQRRREQTRDREIEHNEGRHVQG